MLIPRSRMDCRIKSGNDDRAFFCYNFFMTIKDLEKAVAKLPPHQFAKFRVWFDEFDAARFNQKIERDAKSGKLDGMADQAIDDFRKGRAREL
jgi:hypothetical protein